MSSLDRILPFLRPIEDLLLDPSVTEVMVNDGGRRVFVERDGTLESVPARTLETRNLTVAIKNIARACGDEISDVQPLLDARLEDGSRVAAMFPPCAVAGPVLTIRKFTRRYTLDDLIAVGSIIAIDRIRTRDGRGEREEHPDLGRNGHWEDDSPECPRGSHSGQGPDCLDRGDGGDSSRQTERPSAGSAPCPGAARTRGAATAGHHRGSASRGPTAPARSHSRRRGPRRRSVRPAAGAKYGSSRQPEHHSRELCGAGIHTPGTLRSDGQCRSATSKHT